MAFLLAVNDIIEVFKLLLSGDPPAEGVGLPLFQHCCRSRLYICTLLPGRGNFWFTGSYFLKDLTIALGVQKY